MSDTDTLTGQETPSTVGIGTIDLERSKDLLRGLAHGHYVGIATTDVGVYCVYCGWQHEKYGAEPLHTEDCPIRKARRFLRGV